MRKLTDQQRAEVADLARSGTDLHTIADAYGVSDGYVKALRAGYTADREGKIGHSDATLTAPYTAPEWHAPNMIPGISLKQLMGGRAYPRRTAP